MAQQDVLLIEKNLAGAHRHIYWAEQLAESLSDDGLRLDLQLARESIEKLQVDLLRGGYRGRVSVRRRT